MAALSAGKRVMLRTQSKAVSRAALNSLGHSSLPFC